MGDLFTGLLRPFRLTKPIRLIEMFGGIGAQAMALERLGIPYEHHVLCDFDAFAVKSYNAVHGTSFKPSDVTKLHAADLRIEGTDKWDYVLTWSFPCQAMSMAGKRAGMVEGSGTTSSLGWEIIRILRECGEDGAMPRVLVMENVPQVHDFKNGREFRRMRDALTELGYANRYKDMNAKDYGVPQNRARCFMVSVLGLGEDEEIRFPEPIPLPKVLKDYAEKSVPDKYCLSDAMLKFFLRHSEESGFTFRPLTAESSVSRTVCARVPDGTTDNYFCDRPVQVGSPPKTEKCGNSPNGRHGA